MRAFALVARRHVRALPSVAGSAPPATGPEPHRSSRRRRSAPSMVWRGAGLFAMTPTSGDRHGWSGAESSRDSALIDSQHFSQQHSQQHSQRRSPRFPLVTITHWTTHSNTHSTTHSNTHSNTHRPSSQPCEWKGSTRWGRLVGREVAGWVRGRAGGAGGRGVVQGWGGRGDLVGLAVAPRVGLGMATTTGQTIGVGSSGQGGVGG